MLALDAVVMGMASPEAVHGETIANFEVILLLMFMVTGIYLIHELLLHTFTRILLTIESKMLLSFLFSFTAAFLSAFLDALTVTAVLISVAVGTALGDVCTLVGEPQNLPVAERCDIERPGGVPVPADLGPGAGMSFPRKRILS